MVYWRRFTRTGHLSLHPEKHPKEESCVKKLVSLLIVLCLFPLMLLPASAAASGFWRTVEGGLPPEEQWLPVSDYELIPDYDIENYLPGDPASRDYVSEICIPVRKSK